MNELSEELSQVLRDNGAVLIGFGDVSDLVDDELNIGVAIGLPMPKDMVRSIEKDPTEEYRKWYHYANGVLNESINAGADFLRKQGYAVREQTTDKVQRSCDEYTALPHKSIAIRAGLGWIGKSCLLVTPEYGGALRLSSLVTNAPLSCAEPILKSRCGTCNVCRDICPYDAIKGVTWEQGKSRDEMFDFEKCRSGTAERCLDVIGVRMTICGKCFVFCPYTRKYISK
ncbi:MAG: 4Fe-4S double cluster binding domain-containing protein [Oscillospiraceae bacterium]